MRYRLIFRYLFMQHLSMAVLVLICLFLIVLLGQFADMARYQSEDGGWSGLETFKLALYRSPSLMQAVLPHVLLVSAALTVARACRRSEVTIMMQNGLSHSQILAPVALSAAVLGLVYMLAINPVASYTFNVSEQALSEIEGDAIPRPAHRQPREMVLRDAEGATYLLIEHVPPQGETLHGVTVYRVNNDHALQHGQEAKRAVLSDEGWRLERTREIYRSKALPADFRLPKVIKVDQKALTERYDNENNVSFYNLPGKIDLGRIVGAPVHELQIQFYWLSLLPLLLGSVSLLSGAIVIRPMQRGGWKNDAALVLGAAFTIYTVSTVLDALGARAVVTPWTTVLAMPLLALAMALVLIWVKRRGGQILRTRRRHVAGAPLGLAAAQSG